MRVLVLFTSLAACAMLAACQGSDTEAAAPPKKSLARPATMYAGQEQILRVDKATVERGQGSGALVLKAVGQTDSAGYARLGFLPRVYAAPPPDGVYEVDVVGDRPAAPGAQAATPVEISGAWSKYSDNRVKGVRFIAKTNEIVAMVPPAG